VSPLTTGSPAAPAGRDTPPAIAAPTPASPTPKKGKNAAPAPGFSFR
jgi:hypothetical protein